MTPAPRGERTRAIVLRRTNYGEADRILNLLTPNGQVAVIARGVRREKSKLAGGIELFAISDVVVSKGKGELGILTSARLVQFYRHILEDYDRLQFGYETINLVTRASDMIDEPVWFDVMSEVLMGLDAPRVPLQLTQTWFYLHYASLMGDELNLRADVAGQALTSDRNYMYDIHEKALRPSDQGDITSDHIKFLRLLAAKPIAAVAQIGGVESILGDCWLVARQHAAI